MASSEKSGSLNPFVRIIRVDRLKKEVAFYFDSRTKRTISEYCPSYLCRNDIFASILGDEIDALHANALDEIPVMVKFQWANASAASNPGSAHLCYSKKINKRIVTWNIDEFGDPEGDDFNRIADAALQHIKLFPNEEHVLAVLPWGATGIIGDIIKLRKLDLMDKNHERADLGEPEWAKYTNRRNIEIQTMAALIVGGKPTLVRKFWCKPNNDFASQELVDVTNFLDQHVDLFEKSTSGFVHRKQDVVFALAENGIRVHRKFKEESIKWVLKSVKGKSDQGSNSPVPSNGEVKSFPFTTAEFDAYCGWIVLCMNALEAKKSLIKKLSAKNLVALFKEQNTPSKYTSNEKERNSLAKLLSSYQGAKKL